MSKINEIRDNTVARSKALLVTVADILESVSKRNLAIAEDVAGFAVTQVRLPAEADDFSDYRTRTYDAYSELGKSLKSHGSDLIEVVRDVPGQIRDSLTLDSEPAAKPKPKPKAAKKTAKRKAPAKKAAARKVKVEKVEKEAAAAA